MKSVTHLSCACGKVHVEAVEAPIISVECCCSSCREAGTRLGRLPGAKQVVDAKGATHFVLYRKDRMRFPEGADLLKEFRLSTDAKTRRVVASCCNTPLFLDFKGGHWISVYGALWPEDRRPAIEARTMTSDLPAGTVLPADVPNAKTQTMLFFWKLLRAWAAMGFRSPTIPVGGEIHA